MKFYTHFHHYIGPGQQHKLLVHNLYGKMPSILYQCRLAFETFKKLIHS